MSSEPSRKPPGGPVTATWLAEQRAKQEAYATARRRYRRAWDADGSEAEDESQPADAALGGRARRPSRGKIHDKRQGSFEV